MSKDDHKIPSNEGGAKVYDCMILSAGMNLYPAALLKPEIEAGSIRQREKAVLE